MLTVDKSKAIQIVLVLYISFVFIQSLFFKFTGAPETVHIFSTLDQWASGLGFQGLFLPPGPFNAYVIGTAELVASIFLLAGVFLKKPVSVFLGALLALGIISGAIFFHLFTPLGINVQGDGGLLFYMAVGIFFSSLVLVFLNRKTGFSLLNSLRKS